MVYVGERKKERKRRGEKGGREAGIYGNSKWVVVVTSVADLG